MFKFPEFYMEMRWDVLGAFHMALKQSMQNKISFREPGKNIGKPNGNEK